MDKRYQVFVSSTYEDLRPERQEIMQALLELDCIPAGMELFPAANEDQWTLIKKVIDDCDYYIVVIGGRYGSIGPSGISYTQMEYEYAVSLGKPVIAFIHRDPETIQAKNVEKTSQGKKKLGVFRTLVQKKMCRLWTNPADLGSAVSRSLVKLIKSNPAIGWVKADLSATEEILRLRQQIEDLKAQLSEAGKTSTIGTEDLAQGNDLIPIKFENLQRALEKILGIQKTILDAKTAFEMADEHNARQIASENFAKINLQKIVEAMWIHDEIEHLFSSESKANLAKSRQAFIDAKNDNYANALEEATELIVKGNCFIRDFQNEIKQNLTLHSR